MIAALQLGGLLRVVNSARPSGRRSDKRLSTVRGALTVLPVSGALFLAGFLAITGAPPFGPFLSEFTILRGIVAADRPVVLAVVLVAMATVFIGMGSTVLAATQGEPGDPHLRGQDRFLLTAPPLVMLLAVLMLGLYIPRPLRDLLQAASNLLEAKP